LRRDSFRLFALEDANSNYRFDQSSERIAFSDELVLVGRDSTGVEQLPELRLFEQEQPLLLLNSEQPSYGLVKLIFKRPPYALEEPVFIPEPASIYRKVEKDTLLIRYHSRDTAAMRMLLRGEDFSDTLLIRPKDRDVFLAQHFLGFRQMVPAPAFNACGADQGAVAGDPAGAEVRHAIAGGQRQPFYLGARQPALGRWAFCPD